MPNPRFALDSRFGYNAPTASLPQYLFFSAALLGPRSDMPNTRQSLTSTNTSPLPSSSESNSRMSDIAVRKKKNADAQAAFRARRANYIATLEETGSILVFNAGIYSSYLLDR